MSYLQEGKWKETRVSFSCSESVVPEEVGQALNSDALLAFPMPGSTLKGGLLLLPSPKCLSMYEFDGFFCFCFWYFGGVLFCF